MNNWGDGGKIFIRVGGDWKGVPTINVNGGDGVQWGSAWIVDIGVAGSFAGVIINADGGKSYLETALKNLELKLLESDLENKEEIAADLMGSKNDPSTLKTKLGNLLTIAHLGTELRDFARGIMETL